MVGLDGSSIAWLICDISYEVGLESAALVRLDQLTSQPIVGRLLESSASPAMSERSTDAVSSGKRVFVPG